MQAIRGRGGSLDGASLARFCMGRTVRTYRPSRPQVGFWMGENSDCETHPVNDPPTPDGIPGPSTTILATADPARLAFAGASKF